MKNSKFRTKTMLAIGGLFSVIGVAAGSAAMNGKDAWSGIKADGEKYHLALNETNYIGAVMGSRVKTDNGTLITFTYTGSYENNDHSCFVLDENEYVGNSMPLNGMVSARINYDSSSDLTIQWGWRYGEFLAKATVSSGVSFDFNGDKPSYLRVLNENGESIALSDLDVYFECNESYIPAKYVCKFELNTDGTGYAITGVDKKTSGTKKLEIPAEYNGLPIVSIGANAFNQYGLSAVILGENIKRIETWAFANNSSLTSITLPEGLEYIGLNAFISTNIESVYIPASVTVFGDNRGQVFEPKNMTSIVVDPNNPVYDSRNGCNCVVQTATNAIRQACPTSVIDPSIEIIGETSFNMTYLDTLSIPEGVTALRSQCFGWLNIESVVIPSSVTTINGNVFFGCQKLKTIYCYAESKPSTWATNWIGSNIVDNVEVVWGYTGE